MEPGRLSEERLFGELPACKSSRAARSTAVAAVASLAFHAAIVAGAVWATLAFGREVIAEPEEQITLLEIVDDVREPERPPPPVREPEPPPQQTPPPAPEPEPVAEPEPEEARGFQTLAEPEQIPDETPASSGVAFDESDFTGEGIEGRRGGGSRESEADVAAGNEDQPSLSVYTAAPGLLNLDEVTEAMREFYPRLLKRAGVSGVVLVWVRVDATGQFVKSAIKTSSGREAFDEAALKVTELMRFKPALHGDEPVAVWVIIPIEFRVE